MQFKAAKLNTEQDSCAFWEKVVAKELQIRKLEIELNLKRLEFEEQGRA